MTAAEKRAIEITGLEAKAKEHGDAGDLCAQNTWLAAATSRQYYSNLFKMQVFLKKLSPQILLNMYPNSTGIFDLNIDTANRSSHMILKDAMCKYYNTRYRERDAKKFSRTFDSMKSIRIRADYRYDQIGTNDYEAIQQCAKTLEGLM